MKTLELPDSLYSAFEEAAQEGGFASVADYLVDQYRDVVLTHNRQVFRQMDKLREEIAARTGVQESCVALLREDRDR